MSVQTVTKWSPTASQARLLEAATTGGFNRTVTAICADAGVARQTFYEAMRDENFVRAWEETARAQLRHHLPGVVQALIQKALLGDVQAITKFLSIFGWEDAKQRVEVTTPAEELKSWFASDPDSLKLYMALEARKNGVAGTDGCSMGGLHPGEPGPNGNGHK